MIKTQILAFIILLLSSTQAFGQYVCVQGDCVNGIGKKNVENSSAYLEGKFVDGNLVQGKVVFPTGEIQSGTFENHQLIQGFRLFKDGRKLEGKFYRGVLTEGYITYKDGSKRFIKLKRK